MKNNTSPRLWPFAAIFIAFAVCFFASNAFATAAAIPADQAEALTTAVLETAGATAQPFIVEFAQNHPWALTALALIAALRLVFKPIMAGVSHYVKSTPSANDDAALERIEHSRAFRVFAWLLDYLGSIKVGPRAPTKPTAQS